MELNLHRSGPRDGETLVLLHGIGSRWQIWEPVLPVLAERFDVIALDLPGFGASPMPEDPAAGSPGAETLCDLVLESLASLGVPAGSFHAAGNSLGGLLALELARRGAVRSSCALSPAGFSTDLEMKVVRATLSGSVRIARALSSSRSIDLDAVMRRPRARALLLATFFAHPTRVPPAVAAGDLRALAAAPWFDATLRAQVARPEAAPDAVAAPVTIAWGARDRVLSPRGLRRAATQLPRARTVTLPGCGHLPTWDDPALVARVMMQATADGH